MGNFIYRHNIKQPRFCEWEPCGQIVSQKVREYSLLHFGKMFCFGHQKQFQSLQSLQPHKAQVDQKQPQKQPKNFNMGQIDSL